MLNQIHKKQNNNQNQSLSLLGQALLSDYLLTWMPLSLRLGDFQDYIVHHLKREEKESELTLSRRINYLTLEPFSFQIPCMNSCW